jgi:peptide/nickel transport system permease protein
MISFLSRKIFYAIPVLLGVALITLLLFNVAGGDPARMRLGKAASPEAVDALRIEMGLDQPLYTQYWQFLVDTLSLDFGRSWADETLVTEIFLRGIGPTLSLSLPAFTIGTLLAISLSLLVAYFRGRPIDRIVTTAAIAGISVSSLVYILFGQWLLADQLKLFPIWGYEYGFRALFFLALPIFIWVLLSVGTDIRYYRTVALEEINQDYVRTARAKGLNEQIILFKHVLRNCSVPIITRITIAIPFLMTGSFLLEIFFGIPGLGSELYRSIIGSDFPVVKAFTMLGAVLYVLFNILADVLYAVFDPRIRLS